jgi:hypothetical protein
MSEKTQKHPADTPGTAWAGPLAGLGGGFEAFWSYLKIEK